MSAVEAAAVRLREAALKWVRATEADSMDGADPSRPLSRSVRADRLLQEAALAYARAARSR